MTHEHDIGEERENDTRRDDTLESNFIRASERDNQEYDLRRRMAEATFQQQNESWNQRQTARDAEQSLNRREEQSYSGLTFRDAAIHSTSVGALETATVVAASDIEGEGGVAGAETEENTPDSDDSNTGVAPNNTKTA